MFVAVTLLVTCVCLLVSYLWVLKSRYTYFIRRNLPGPPPHFFFGHYLTLWKLGSYPNEIQEWTRQYGPIYGLFEGTRPMYVVSDLDFLEQIFIKQFSFFHSRRTNFLLNIQKAQGTNLFSAHADQWRRQRHVINPTFSTLKLKIMAPLMNKCIESMLVKAKDMAGKQFNIYSLYKRLTLDVIWHCAFGIDTDMQNNLGDIYLRKSIACFATDTEKLLIVKLSNLMPFLIPILTRVVRARAFVIDILQKLSPSLTAKADTLAVFWVIAQVEAVVKQRLASGNRRMDLLQSMLDAVTDEETKENDPSSKQLHYDEVVMNAFLFMLAGFESTSAVLAYSTYVLATHLDIQTKLQAEIDEHWKDDDVDYDITADMTYMDLFIREVIRMYRVSGQNSTRQCNQTTTVCGHQIDEGCVILTDVHTIHYSAELWGPEDPYSFVPERHADKRHPIAYMGFGVGSRNCVGMRFALMELKMCLTRLLHTYTILPGEAIEQGMNRQKMDIIRPQAINVRLEKRSN